MNNDEWLKGAYDAFGQALLHKEIRFAKEIIADTFDAGFPEQARMMNDVLRTTVTN